MEIKNVLRINYITEEDYKKAVENAKKKEIEEIERANIEKVGLDKLAEENEELKRRLEKLESESK